MVDSWSGRWIPEDDYSDYPEEKMCDYDRVYLGLKEVYPDYEPETSWERIIEFALSFFEDQWEELDYESDSAENCVTYIVRSGGIKEFDYED